MLCTASLTTYTKFGSDTEVFTVNKRYSGELNHLPEVRVPNMQKIGSDFFQNVFSTRFFFETFFFRVKIYSSTSKIPNFKRIRTLSVKRRTIQFINPPLSLKPKLVSSYSVRHSSGTLENCRFMFQLCF